jgi:transposase
MDALEQLKEDIRSGRIDPLRFVDLLDRLQQQLQTTQRLLQTTQQQLQTTQQQLQTANQRIAELEKHLAATAGTAKLEQAFSVQAEEKRQETRGKKKRQRKEKGKRGRIPTADKIARADRTEDVYPEGVAPGDCWLSHTRVVWRLEWGSAVLIAYRVFRGPNSRYGQISGVLGRSEFGLEIVVAIAYQVYVIGLSFDKVCLLLHFFQNLTLSKSQAEALLARLARHWQKEFDILCTLLANSLVVHADETSWSINSVWAILSEKARLLLFGVHKDAATLEKILDPATFAGIVISDDAQVYAHFSQAQKCWAHLLRKAIKLTLQEPQNAEYRAFADRLLEIYRWAVRVQRDGRFRDEGRQHEVSKLEDALAELCLPRWLANLPPRRGVDGDFQRLVNEVCRLLIDEQLFTFVTAEPVTQPNGTTQAVGGTNNEAERTLRNPALARKTGRTSKTMAGARRQTIVTSVLESLRLYLPVFTLVTVITAVGSWLTRGRSYFEELLEKLGLAPPAESILDTILPAPSG